MTAIFIDRFFSFLFIWMFLLCCIFLWCVIYNIALKKISYSVLSVAFCMGGFLVMQISKYQLTKPMNICFEKLYINAGTIPCIFWILLGLGLSSAAATLLFFTLRWRKNHITPMTIKDCGDRHPAAIVLYKDTGRVLFTNTTADYISMTLQDRPVLNGIEFLQELPKENIELPDGSIWKLKHETFLMDQEEIHQLVITDITALHKKNQELERETKRLQVMNDKLLEYNHHIEELVRKQEILNARICIHDEMNHLLMATEKAFEENDKSQQMIMLDSWKKDTALLFHEQRQDSDIEEDLKTYGSVLGINFVSKSLTKIKDNKTLHFTVRCAREAMNNGVKHGKAKNLWMDVESINDSWLITLKNDGDISTREITPVGGLLNLKEEAKNLGGNLLIQTNPAFTLVISIPKEEKKDVFSVDC